MTDHFLMGFLIHTISPLVLCLAVISDGHANIPFGDTFFEFNQCKLFGI